MLLSRYFNSIFTSKDIYNRNLVQLFELGERLMIQRGTCDCHPGGAEALLRIKEIMIRKNI